MRSAHPAPVHGTTTNPGWYFDVRLAVWLVALDVTLVLIYLVRGYMVVIGRLGEIPHLLNVGRDWSLGEMIGYAKWIFLIAAMIVSYRREPNFIFLALALLFIVTLADDTLQLHETHNRWTTRSGLIERSDLALREVGYFATVGLAVAVPLLIGWFRADPPLRRKVAPLLLLFGAIAFCGIGVDFIHASLPDRSVGSGLAGAVEDGGEMIFLSLMFSYAIATFWRPRLGSPSS